MIVNDIKAGTANIVDNATVRKIINDVLTDVNSAVNFTLGPSGNTSLLHDPNGVTSLYPNKDGYNQIMNLHYDDYFYDAVLKIVRDAAMHCNTTIGDATTSSVVILNAFYKELRETFDNIQFEYCSDAGVVNALDVIRGVIKDFLYKKKFINRLEDLASHDIKMRVLTKVATVAANNDESIGKYVANIFDKTIETRDEIDVSITPNNFSETTESTEIGFFLPCGHIHRIYSTERDGRTAIYSNPRFLIVEGPLLDGDLKVLEPIIGHVCIANSLPLVIIAEDYSKTVMQWLYALRVGGGKIKGSDGKDFVMEPLDILPIQHSSASDLGHEQTVDLEVALGGRALPLQSSTLDPDKIPDTPTQIELILGRSKKIISAGNECRIFEGAGNTDKIAGRIKDIEEIRDGIVITDSDMAQLTIASYNERIAMLKSNMISIKVGGQSFKERQYNVRVFEDAVYACKACIKHGYTLIGQVSLYALIKQYKDELIREITTQIIEKKINVVFGDPKKKQIRLGSVINTIFDVILRTINTAYTQAIKNSIRSESAVEEIFATIEDEIKNNTGALSYNILDDAYYGLDEDNCPIFSAGSTDWEILNSIIFVTSIFFNVKTLMTLYIPLHDKTDK